MESKYFNQVKGEGIRFIQKPLDFGYSASIEACESGVQHEEEKKDTRKKSKKGGSKSKSATKHQLKKTVD